MEVSFGYHDLSEYYFAYTAYRKGKLMIYLAASADGQPIKTIVLEEVVAFVDHGQQQKLKNFLVADGGIVRSLGS